MKTSMYIDHYIFVVRSLLDEAAQGLTVSQAVQKQLVIHVSLGGQGKEGRSEGEGQVLR